MKLLLIGLSGTGKSTLAQLLGKKFQLAVYEADDEVMELNSGNWPDSDELIDKGFAIANEKALNMDNVVFVTTFLSITNFNRFTGAEYKVIELTNTYDELVSRKIARDGMTQTQIEKFKQTYREFDEFINVPTVKEHIALTFNTTLHDTNTILEKIASIF